jgi:hypothetical protein
MFRSLKADGTVHENTISRVSWGAKAGVAARNEA